MIDGGTPDGTGNDVIDAEFVETEIDGAGNAGAEAGSAPESGKEHALVLTHQSLTERVQTLAAVLQRHGVPPEVQQEIIDIAHISLLTAGRVHELDLQVQEMITANDARNKALAALLLGEKCQGESDVTAGKAKEKAPDKLRPLIIETPEQAELVTEQFVITVENPNAEEVKADIQIKLQDFDGKEDLVLEAVVNPTENKAGVLTARPITLKPDEKKEVLVALRLKQGKDAHPEVKDITAQQITINVKLTPTDPDTTLPEREFPTIQRDIRFNDTYTHESKIVLVSYRHYPYYNNNEKYSTLVQYSVNVPNIEFKNHKASNYDSEVRLISKVNEAQLGEVVTLTFTGGFDENINKARTVKRKIPVNIKFNVTARLDPIKERQIGDQREWKDE